MSFWYALWLVLIIMTPSLLLYHLIHTLVRNDPDPEPAAVEEAPEPREMRVVEELDPDSPFDADPDYVAMRQEAIVAAFTSGRTVVGDASGWRYADESEAAGE